MSRFRSRLFAFLCVLALVAVVWVTHGLWMAALGNCLVRADAPGRAELAVVLAGDFYGHRVLKAGELVREGYVPQVLVSGPRTVYGLHECDIAIPFAVRHGYPARWFIPWPHEAHSTDEEARAILPELRRRGIHRFLLVTSDYHSARAGRIFRAQGPEFDIRVVAAPDEFYRPAEWWRNREGRKVFALEWAKTIATLVGL